MKANPRLRSTRKSFLALPFTASALLLAGCVPQVAAPPHVPPPAPTRSHVPPPTAAPPASTDWRDAPITPGDWQWNTTALGSTASFAGGAFLIRCEPQRGTVLLMRAAMATTPTPMTITTTDTSRTFTAQPVAGGIAVSLPARDSLLDSMAFSRGRFAVTSAGAAPLYIPSWTEVSRVIEDCR
jgi:hypothetical protein